MSAAGNDIAVEGGWVLEVSARHPSLEGHFPGQPVVPGVLILDRISEALCAQFPGHVMAGLPQVKFLSPLLPEQAAQIAWTQRAGEAGQLEFRFTVTRGGDVLARGNLLLRQAKAGQ